MAAFAHGDVELGGPQLRAAGDVDRLRAGGVDGSDLSARARFVRALGWCPAGHRRSRSSGPDISAHHRARQTRGAGMKWLLVSVVVQATTAGEVQEAKR